MLPNLILPRQTIIFGDAKPEARIQRIRQLEKA
jgi:hypothetical protein